MVQRKHPPFQVNVHVEHVDIQISEQQEKAQDTHDPKSHGILRQVLRFSTSTIATTVTAVIVEIVKHYLTNK